MKIIVHLLRVFHNTYFSLFAFIHVDVWMDEIA